MYAVDKLSDSKWRLSFMIEKIYEKKMTDDVIMVTLGCGRNMSFQSNMSDPNSCGSAEDATSNQTQATCCY